MPNFKLMTLATVALLSAPAMAQNGQLRDLSVEQASVVQAGVPRPSSLQVSLAADRADATYGIGDMVKLTFTASEDAYVTVLDIGPTGRVVRLFPNQYQIDNHVLANHPVEIGGGSSGAKVSVSGPVGAELIKVIASTKPLSVVAESQLQGGGVFRTLEGGAAALVRDLQVTADQAAAQDSSKIAFTNLALRTVDARAAAAPAPIAAPGQEPERATADDMRSAKVFNGRGNAYYSKGEYDHAIADYDEAIKLDPTLVAPFNGRGNAYYRKGDYDRAIADYDQAIKLASNFASPFNGRGNAFYSKGDYDRAIADYDQAIKLDPKLVVAFLDRGNAYYRKGDYDRAMADYNQAIKLDPKYAGGLDRQGNADNQVRQPIGLIASQPAGTTLILTPQP